MTCETENHLAMNTHDEVLESSRSGGAHRRPPRPVVIGDAADLGRAMRERRRALGLTQVYCASALGFSPRLIGEMERGRATVSFDKMLTYSRELGIDLLFLPRGDPKPKPSPLSRRRLGLEQLKGNTDRGEC